MSSLEEGKKEEEFLWKEGLVLNGDRALEEVLSSVGMLSLPLNYKFQVAKIVNAMYMSL